MCSVMEVVLVSYSSGTVIYNLKAKVTCIYSIFQIYLESGNFSYCLPLSKETDCPTLPSRSDHYTLLTLKGNKCNSDIRY